MSIKKIDKETGDIGNLIAGGTLFADSPLLTVVSSYDTVAAPGWKLLTTDVAGRTLSRTEYKELFDLVTERGLIGEGKPFGEGDGSTTFVLPDAREATFKGIGLTGYTVGAHLDEDGLAVGEFLDDRIQDHKHSMSLVNSLTGDFGRATGASSTEPVISGASTEIVVLGRSGATTEVKSIGVNYFMKVKIVSVPADFVSAMDKIYGVLIPSNASPTNKLVAKSDTVTKYNYTMVGTSSLEDDIKTFVTALITLGANTYAGFFNRSGALGTAGNYSITVYAEEGTSSFASGYIALGAGAMGKTQYEVSYYKPTGSSEEWTIKKLVTPEDLSTITLGDYQLSVDGDTYAWFDLGTSTSTSNSQAFLFYEITYGRVDGAQSKILVSCSGTMADLNYIKVVNLNGAQTSATEQLKLDSNKHIWIGMQSYCYAHVKVYGRWTGMGSKTTTEPTGTIIPIYKLATTDNLPTSGVGAGINKQDIVSGDANTAINIPAYHFCSGFMYLSISGIGTALLSYDIDFNRNLTLKTIAGTGLSLTGLTLYKGQTPLGTFSANEDYIVFSAQYYTIIRTNYASL